jgi:hypothetical protein
VRTCCPHSDDLTKSRECGSTCCPEGQVCVEGACCLSANACFNSKGYGNECCTGETTCVKDLGLDNVCCPHEDIYTYSGNGTTYCCSAYNTTNGPLVRTEAGCCWPTDVRTGSDGLKYCCSDLVKNGRETDVDCGGDCPNTCRSGKTCNVNSDCYSNLCVGGICS